MSPRLRKPIAVLVSLLALLAIGAAQVAPRLEDWTGETEPRFQLVSMVSGLADPALDLRPDAPIGANDTGMYGVNVFLEQEVEEWKLRHTFALLKAGGTTWVRQQIPWKDIEVLGKGRFEDQYGSTWQKYDRFLNAAAENGISVLARLDGPPDWTRSDNRVYNRPPDNLADYADFVEAFVARYKGVVSAIQIWNEPNIFPEWGWREVDAPAYAALLKLAAARARAANPEILIVAAALAPTNGTPDGFNESDLTFLQKLYDAGAAESFDVMSAMGYSPWTGPQDRRVEADRVNFSRVQLIRDIMVRNGDSKKPLWIAEMGWNALPGDFGAAPTHGQVSRERQARYLTDAYERARVEWPWVGVVFSWHLRLVHDENRDQQNYYFGFADADFALHENFFAFRALATRPPSISPGWKSESHPAVGYRGEWTYVDPAGAEGYALRTDRSGDSIAFVARGTDISLVLHRGPGLGTVTVHVDGAPTPLLPDGRLSLSLRDHSWAPVVVAKNLAPGEHRVDVYVTQGPVEFDGVIVRERSPAASGALAAATLLAGILALVAAISTAWSERAGGSLLASTGAQLRRLGAVVLLPRDVAELLHRDLPGVRLRSYVAEAVREKIIRSRSSRDSETARNAYADAEDRSFLG